MPLLEEVDPEAGDSAEGAEGLKAAHRRRRASKKKKRADVRACWCCCCLDVFALEARVGCVYKRVCLTESVCAVLKAVCLAWCVEEL